MIFSKTSRVLTKADIAEAETRLGLSFPESFTRHYLKHNGGIPLQMIMVEILSVLM